MTNEEAVRFIKQTLSAGNLVHLELLDEAILDFLHFSFIRCKPWFLDPVVWETIDIHSGQNGGNFFLLNQLSKPLKNIHRIYPTVQTGFSGFDQDVSGLLSLEGKHLQTMDLIETSYATQYERQTNNVLSVNVHSITLPDRVLLSGSFASNQVTVGYNADPATFADVTHPRATEWILDYSLAKSMYALGRSRSKFRSSDLNIDTDGMDLVTEATDKLRLLEDALPQLDFTGESAA